MKFEKGMKVRNNLGAEFTVENGKEFDALYGNGKMIKVKALHNGVIYNEKVANLKEVK